MIFSFGASRNQNVLEQGTINHIFSEIKKRRIEPTNEADGKAKFEEEKEYTLKELCVRSLISMITPTDLGFVAEEIPTDIRLEMFAELCKRDMPDSAIKLLQHSNIKYIRIQKNVTDRAIELLSSLCPLLETAYIRSNAITIKPLINLLQTCSNIISLDIGWTKVFDRGDESDVRRFFQLFPPTLTSFVMRGTGPRHLQLRTDLLCQYGQHLITLNIGRTSLKCEHIVAIMTACGNIENLLMDRMKINDNEFKEIIQVCGKRIKHLDIGDTLATDKGLIAIAQNCPILEIIGLRNLPLVEVGMTLLCQNAPKLRSIDLGGCYETTDNAIEAISKLEKLLEINLEGLYLISEEKVKELINNCKYITRIEIPENPPLISQSFRSATIKGREWRARKRIPVTGY